MYQQDTRYLEKGEAVEEFLQTMDGDGRRSENRGNAHQRRGANEDILHSLITEPFAVEN